MFDLKRVGISSLVKIRDTLKIKGEKKIFNGCLVISQSLHKPTNDKISSHSRSTSTHKITFCNESKEN